MLITLFKITNLIDQFRMNYHVVTSESEILVTNSKELFLTHIHVHCKLAAGLFHVIFIPGPRLQKQHLYKMWQSHGRGEREMVKPSNYS